MKKDYGTKYKCYSCGCVFYDMHANPPLCPKCQANQFNAPKTKTKSHDRSATAGATTSGGSGGADERYRSRYHDEDEEYLGNLDNNAEMTDLWGEEGSEAGGEED